jgi:hypothetical protein
VSRSASILITELISIILILFLLDFRIVALVQLEPQYRELSQSRKHQLTEQSHAGIVRADCSNIRESFLLNTCCFLRLQSN